MSEETVSEEDVLACHMTLRDWFAGTATDADVEAYDSISAGESRANARYRYADAMLAERRKPK